MEENQGNIPLYELGLKSRPYNCLFRAGIQSVEELLALSPVQLIRLRGMGFDSYHHIVARLETQGYDTSKYPHFERKADFYMGGPTWGIVEQ